MSLAFAPARTTTTVRPVQARTAPTLPAAPAAAPLRSVTTSAPAQRVADAAPDATAAAPRAAGPRVRAVPEGTEARGFVLYVGIDEAKALADGTTLHRIVEALRALTAEVAPSA